MNELLKQEVCRRIELYCVAKGCAELSGVNSFVPQDAVTAFGMASYIANEIGCTHYVVLAPRGHIYGYFFTELGCKVMEMYVSDLSGDIQVTDDLSSIRNRRVFIIEEDFESESSLQSVVSLLLQYDPAEICLFLGNSGGFERLENVSKSISQTFISDQIYNFISSELLEKKFADFFALLVPVPAVGECVEERLQPRQYQASGNIGKTVKPFFKRLKHAWDNRAETNQRYKRDMPVNISLAQNNIADNSSFLYFMMNIFKPGCMTHVSVRPGLAIPLSLMLVLKYSRGIQQTEKRKKALLISLTHPIEIAESLMAYCLQRSIKPILNGEILDRDWPKLTRAAGDVFELGIDFWKEGVLFEADRLKHIIESSEWPFGLVVINDSTGQLDQGYCGTTCSVQQQLKNIRSLTTLLELPVIIIDSGYKQEIVDAEVFDHIAQLNDDLDRFQLFIKKSDLKAYGKLTFVMSQSCNILVDALSNFMQTTPTNYNSGSE